MTIVQLSRTRTVVTFLTLSPTFLWQNVQCLHDLYTLKMTNILVASILLCNVLITFSSTVTVTTFTTEPILPCNTHECKEDGYFSEGDCDDTFCQCVGGRGFLHTCKEGTFYDPVMEVCNWPWNIPSCTSTVGPTPVTTPTGTSTLPVSECSYKCTEENGLYAEGCCEESYCQCFHGEGFLQFCPPGSVWSQDEGFCDEKENVECCMEMNRMDLE